MNWTLEQLRHFVAAADAGSFSAAARQVGRAQSAVSTSLGLLEADLGVELFDRSRRNATLTRAGEVLLLEARELLRQAGGLEQRALSFAAGQDARLSVALDEALPDRVLAVLVREVSTRFPALELTQLNGTATEVADYVQQGRASVAFHFDRGDPGAAFAHRYLGDVGQGIFVARDHPLAAMPEVTRNDLARHRQLVMQMEGVEDVVMSPSAWRSDSFYSIAAMVAHSLSEYQDQIRVQAERLLSAAATQAREAGVPCETLRATDEDPYRAIINAAAERGCDLIAMASHGRRGMAAVVLGSQTQKVLAHSATPVLVYRKQH